MRFVIDSNEYIFAAEWRGVDALVTENRHFLSRQADLPFKILTAENCLKILNK